MLMLSTTSAACSETQREYSVTHYSIRASVRFQYFQTLGKRKWGKTKEKGDASQELVPVLCHEMSVQNTNPKYVGRYNNWSWHSHSNVSDKLFCTDSTRWILHPAQKNTHPPHASRLWRDKVVSIFLHRCLHDLSYMSWINHSASCCVIYLSS